MIATKGSYYCTAEAVHLKNLASCNVTAWPLHSLETRAVSEVLNARRLQAAERAIVKEGLKV